MGAKLTIAFLLILAAGCATKKNIVAPTVVHTVAPAIVTPLPTPTPAQAHEYQVKPGDCLWTITENRGTDPFLWPSLWKANRDFIRDPDKIEIGEWLDFPDGVSMEEISWALTAAYNWPELRPAKSRGTTRNK